MAISITNNTALLLLDTLTALLDADTAGPGSLVIYAGSVPADADASLGAAVTLVTFDLAADAFDAATDDTPGAVALANTIADENAVATNTATFFRILNSAGAAVLQGTVGTSAADCIVTSTSFVTGQPCHVVGVTLRHPE
jgi:hypothetical protein